MCMLALSYSRIPSVQGGVYCLPCGGWALVCVCIYIILILIHYVGGILVLVYCRVFSYYRAMIFLMPIACFTLSLNLFLSTIASVILTHVASWLYKNLSSIKSHFFLSNSIINFSPKVFSSAYASIHILCEFL